LLVEGPNSFGLSKRRFLLSPDLRERAQLRLSERIVV